MATTDVRELGERVAELASWLGDGTVAGLGVPAWVAPLKWRSVKEAPARGVASFTALDLERDEASLKRLFERAANWAGSTQLVLGFQPASSGAAMVTTLGGEGGRANSRWEVGEVEALAAAFGFRVTARAQFTDTKSSLAGHTVEALRQLFVQLNPNTAVDYVLLALTQSKEVAQVAPRASFEPGLLSVVMRNHSLSREALLDHALFSLAAQSYRKLEIVLVTQSMEPNVRDRLEALLTRHQRLGGYSFKVVLQPSSEDIRARLVNVGIANARGQYVAFLDDDDVVYPRHYQRLISALEQDGKHAWAFAPIRRAYFTVAADETLYCTRKDIFPRSGGLDLARLFHDNYVTCHSYVIDRTRIGAFELGFEELLDKGEDYALLLRLLAVFRPLAIGGPPSAEYRIRDNGTNTIIHDSKDKEARARLRAKWEVAIELKNRLTASLQVLMTKSEFVLETRKHGLLDDDPRKEPEELRYRLADMANAALKKGLPFVHSTLKGSIDPRLNSKK